MPEVDWKARFARLIGPVGCTLRRRGVPLARGASSGGGRRSRRYEPSYLFTLRIWVRKCTENPAERWIRVQDLETGEVHHLSDWPELIALLARRSEPLLHRMEGHQSPSK